MLVFDKVAVLVVVVEVDRLDLSCALRPYSKSVCFCFNHPVRSLSKKHPKTVFDVERLLLVVMDQMTGSTEVIRRQIGERLSQVARLCK